MFFTGGISLFQNDRIRIGVITLPTLFIHQRDTEQFIDGAEVFILPDAFFAQGIFQQHDPVLQRIGETENRRKYAAA